MADLLPGGSGETGTAPQDLSRSLQEKSCMITGATSGIGRVLAFQLASRGARLILVGRNEAKCLALLKDLQDRGYANECLTKIADLSSQADIRRLLQEFHASGERLDVLINNAGALFGRRCLTVDNIEMSLALNHLAPFQLTLGLLGALHQSPQGRVINVSSFAHRFAWLRLDDLQSSAWYIGWWAYAHAKLANLLFTFDLANRLGQTRITVNAYNPGLIDSGFGRKEGGVVSLVKPVLNLLSASVETGADTGVFLAAHPDLRQFSGGYFHRRRLKRSSRSSRDLSQASKLWDASSRLVDLGADPFLQLEP